jgi:hypothetical protein
MDEKLYKSSGKCVKKAEFFFVKNYAKHTI